MSQQTTATRRENMAAALGNHAHVCLIVGVLGLSALYFIRHATALQSKAALIGDLIQLVVASIGGIGSLVALISIGLLKGTDFGKLEKFQTYIILGIGVSVLVSGLAVLNSLGFVKLT